MHYRFERRAIICLLSSPLPQGVHPPWHLTPSSTRERGSLKQPPYRPSPNSMSLSNRDSSMEYSRYNPPHPRSFPRFSPPWIRRSVLVCDQATHIPEPFQRISAAPTVRLLPAFPVFSARLPFIIRYAPYCSQSKQKPLWSFLVPLFPSILNRQERPETQFDLPSAPPDSLLPLFLVCHSAHFRLPPFRVLHHSARPVGRLAGNPVAPRNTLRTTHEGSLPALDLGTCQSQSFVTLRGHSLPTLPRDLQNTNCVLLYPRPLQGKPALPTLVVQVPPVRPVRNRIHSVPALRHRPSAPADPCAPRKKPASFKSPPPPHTTTPPNPLPTLHSTISRHRIIIIILHRI